MRNLHTTVLNLIFSHMKQHFHWLLWVCMLCPIFAGAQQNKDFFRGAPVFHGATVVGNYPQTPFLFTVPATGDRPITFKATGLPPGLAIDPISGIITGRVAKEGEYTVHIDASNRQGEASRDIKIVIGDNLALTPPMGWNSWNVFAWDVDEDIIKKVADAMATNGMRDLGYQFINIDDFWHADSREEDGRPKADPKKFPHGMKYLCDYVHSKGLKLGIYSCAGDKTCGKKFGGYEHEEIDAKTYAEWGIDLLKYDYCYAKPSQKQAKKRYRTMGDALKHSGRSIVFSICEWGKRKPWIWGAKVGGQYWRTTGDIYDDWGKVMSIVNEQKGLEKYSGPGHWNDPDMLLVGNFGKGRATGGGGKHTGCTNLEYQSHMSLWCLLDAPLLTSNDLSKMDDSTYAILTNGELLDINQDPLGKQASIARKDNSVVVYYKPLANGDMAVGMFNTDDEPTSYQLIFGQIPNCTGTYTARDVWQHKDMAQPETNVMVNLAPHEVKVLRLKH